MKKPRQEGYYNHTPTGTRQVVKLNHNSRPVKMLIIEPENFEEVQTIVEHS